MTTSSPLQGSADNRPITDPHRLRQMARQFIEDYPDAHGLAYAEARKLLLRYTGKRLDPEKVYWHRFSSAMSSPRTFTGWQHTGPPVQSMTFVELLIQRFSVRDQDAADELQLYGGFYTDGPDQDRFDEQNELAILPQQVMSDFWALDFSSLFMARMERFWTLHSDHFCTLARARFLTAAVTQWRDGSLSHGEFRRLSRVVLDHAQTSMTLEALQGSSRPVGISFATFDIGGYACAESLRMIDASGRQIIYLPGDTQAFHVFGSEPELYEWVQGRLRDEPARSAFMLLFLRSDAARQLHHGFFADHLQQIVANPWVAGQTLVNQNRQLIEGDAFVHLRDLARQQMQTDAHSLLTSNLTLRKQMFMGFLNAFINVFGVMAPLGWPMALTLVGAATVNVALNIDQAINGTSPRARKAGIVGAVLNSLFIVFNFFALVGLGRLRGTAPSEPTGAAQGQGTLPASGVAPTPESIPLLEINNPLSTLEDNVIGGSIQAAPANAAFTTVRSTFWDIHMQFNLPEEVRLSQLGLARQEAALELRGEQAGDDLFQDANGSDVILDLWGDEHRVFQKASGEYVGGRIAMYAVRDTLFNQFLRTGVSTGADQVELIQELADDLLSVGGNNDVALYRGGSAVRGTSGSFFRQAHIKAGDVLVNTDFTSFSENPYVARAFASSQAGENSADFATMGRQISFDDSSVVFELPAKHSLGATPVALFSGEQQEVESLFTPGHYFLIDGIQEVAGEGFRFIKVQITEIPAPKTWHRLFDLRTGAPFSREVYAAKLGDEGKPLVARFFPLTATGLST
jgi:hypothetical protein